MNKDFLIRLTDEKIELEMKLSKLKKFIENDIDKLENFWGIEEYKTLMILQKKVMETYLEILKRRVEIIDMA